MLIYKLKTQNCCIIEFVNLLTAQNENFLLRFDHQKYLRSMMYFFSYSDLNSIFFATHILDILYIYIKDLECR